jgi:ligand-binding sensor domain-containing protein
MKLILILTRRIQPTPSRRRASARLPEPPAAGKRNRLAAALAALVAAAPAARAADAWHVGPIPEVRAVCHAGDALWVGTSAGVFVLDIRNGALVERITAGPRLPSASVRAIAARGDSVFVGTDAGLACLYPNGGKVWTPREPGTLGAVPLARIQDVSFAANGSWLISTGGGGLGVVTRAGGYAITRRDSLLADNVYGVMDRPGGVRWFATSAGLCALTHDTTLVSFQAGAGIPRGEVRQIVGGGRAAYLLVSGRGVFRFDGARAVALEAPKDLPLRDALSLSYGADGALWVAGGSWAAVLRAGKWSRVALSGADKDQWWRVVVADGGGAFLGSSRGVVLATGRGGVFRAELPGLLPSARVASLCTDGADAAWFVSGGAAVRADVRTREVRVETQPVAAQSIAVLRAGTVVTAGRWSVRGLRGGAWTDLRPDVPEADPAFTVVRAGERGEMWVGTRAGSLYRYDGEVWLRVARADALIGHGPVVDAFVVHGDVWSRIDGRTAVARSGLWHRPDGIDSSTTVVDVARSPAGEWIAAASSGLFRLDPDLQRWSPATPFEIVGGERGRKDALRATITAAVFGPDGDLYLGTTEGVVRVGRDGLHSPGPDAGIPRTEVTDLAAGNHYLWIGFAQEGLSVVALEEVR